MFRTLLLAGLLVITACGREAPREPASTGAGTREVTVLQPGVTLLAGARDRPGLFAQRVVFPAGFCSPPHSHDSELHGLVLRGVLRLGVADSTGRIVVREYPTGSFIPIPAGRVHVEGAAEETEIYVTGVGPVHTTQHDGGSTTGCAPK